MIANLPLLFAKGNPTALRNITAPKLEKFITFMVTCSWGHDTAKEIRKPPWWPENVPFSHPFVRPNIVPSDWEVRLKNLVKKCYTYHKSTFLLVFSAQLARYPHHLLKYVDNLDFTTSLYYNPSGRLLVTFRNENMYYDKCDQFQVKSTDIYLCDNCDSHFDNPDLLRAHERLCNNEDAPSSTCSGGLQDLLTSLKLRPVGESSDVAVANNNNDVRQKHSRSAASIDRGPPYPFSSLAYMKNAKINTQRDMTFSRERIERYCCDMNIKNVASKSKNQQFPVRYRRPIDYWKRKHTFPRQRKKEILDLNAQLLYLKCRPISVSVERMSTKSMEDFIEKLRKESEERRKAVEKGIAFVDVSVDRDVKDCDQLDECEVIDLCSDDETPDGDENYDPRAGVTCVIRGGAVLQRTAATPNSLPAEPCGARHSPIVIQQSPIILITHTLSNKPFP